MRAQLKANKSWVTIDTRHLFNDQYNAVEGNKRIFDRDILRMEDDVRDGLGRCGYCGALITKNPGTSLNGGILPTAEEHFAAMESKRCAECWWYQDRCIQRDVEKVPEQVDSVSLGGDQFRKTTVSKRIITEIYEKQCTWNQRDSRESDCTNKEHRRLGINWFTKENTFFLRYPNGLPVEGDLGKLRLAGFVYEEGKINMEYFKKLGSYWIDAQLKYEDGKPVGVSHFHVYNCVKSFDFYPEDDGFMCRGSCGDYTWKHVKHLPVPEKIEAQLKKICVF